MRNQDLVQRFVFEKLPMRGQIVHLDATWRAVLDRHGYPVPVRDLLGEAMVATALLSSTLKFRGSLILQLHGEGPVSMLVVEYTTERTLRALAHWSGQVPSAPLSQTAGAGRLVITIDPSDEKRRYQSIVSLSGDSIAEVLANYLSQSEQIDTRLWIASDAEAAAGILLQKLPGEWSDDDAWDRATLLGDTVAPAELLTLSSRLLLRRLYREDDIRLFDAEPISFRCTCSRGRVGNMLQGLGRAEVEDILREQGKIGVHCEFCNQYYEFDSIDAELSLGGHAAPETPTAHH